VEISARPDSRPQVEPRHERTRIARREDVIAPTSFFGSHGNFATRLMCAEHTELPFSATADIEVDPAHSTLRPPVDLS
jgi:hypothetical protein